MPSSSPTTLPTGLRLGNLIKQCEQALIAEKHRALHGFDLTVPQYAALLALSESPRISGAQLSRRCGVTPQAMNGVISLLEGRGLIVRTRSEVHAKVLIIQLTPGGRALLRKADQEAVQVEQRLMGAFTGEQLAEFREHLNTAIEALSNRPAPEPAQTPVAAGGGSR